MVNDEQYMAIALEEARQGSYSTSPNPRVGCLFVKDGQIIGKGFHAIAGGPHAEIVAIQQATDSLAGATAYITLEPCAHYGKTPPCCEALIQLQLSRVVVAMEDPNPLVAGKGIRAMREAGIPVEVGVCQEQARSLNRGFIKRMTQGRPWMFGKVAISLDGAMALSSGKSQWITGSRSRLDAMKLRAQSCCIVTSVNTIQADNPLFTARLTTETDQLELPLICQPDLVVLDPRFAIPEKAQIFDTAANRKIYIIVGNSFNEAHKRLRLENNPQVRVIELPTVQDRVNLASLVLWLAAQEYNEVMVESGPTLMTQFIQDNWLDELVVYQAPILLGKTSKSLYQASLDSMNQAKKLKRKAHYFIEEDSVFFYEFQ